MAWPLPRSQPLPAGSQLLPAGVPSAAGLGGWLAAPAAGAPIPGTPAPGRPAPGPSGPAGAAGDAGEPGAPALPAGVNDGGAGPAGTGGPGGAGGENLGVLAGAVARGARAEPWGGLVAGGGDR